MLWRYPRLGSGFRTWLFAFGVIFIEAIVATAAVRAEQIDRVALSRSWSPLLFEVQTALAQLGFYNGAVDGQYSIATGHAIRRYRQMHRLPSIGQDWRGLMAHLDVQVRQTRHVASGLDRARINQFAAARALLDEGLEVQQLIHGPADEPATRNLSYECLVVPTADCLFASAAAGVEEVERQEYRNWALRDLIREEAMAGRADAASSRLRKLSDPRLIFVALREIAEGLAHTGNLEKAAETARAIPEPVQRLRAQIAIAKALLEKRQLIEARRLGDEILDLSTRLRNVAERVLIISSLAAKYVDAGDVAFGRDVLNGAARKLEGQLDGPARDAAWATVARVRLALGDRGGADEALHRIENERVRMRTMAGVGDGENGFAEKKQVRRLSSSIAGLRYRVLALTEVARGNWARGDRTDAAVLLRRAEGMVEELDSPFAGSYAFARISDSYARFSLLEEAVRLAGKIKDDDLRARTYWNLSRRLNENGAFADSAILEERAMETAAGAISTFDRAALLGGFAADLAKARRIDFAHEAFERAMAESRKIKRGWWRVRALARLARVKQVIERYGAVHTAEIQH